MTGSTNSLVKIPRSDWCKLRDLYINRKTESCSFIMFQCLIHWMQQNSELDVEIFALNGDWESDGTFIVKAFSNFQIYCNTLNENLDRLTAALNCLDVHSNHLIGGFPQRIFPAVERFFIDSGAEFKPDVTVWYHKPREELMKAEIIVPPGIQLDRLKLTHAEYINSVWQHRSPGSLTYVEYLIAYNESVGAFDQKNGELLAYCLQLPFGSLGVLRVEEQHRKKGLAQLVVSHLAKTLASKNFEVVSPVVLTNCASRALFEKLGFNIVDRVYWAVRPPAAK